MEIAKYFAKTSINDYIQIFWKPHLDYGNVIYDEAFIETFHQKHESVQYDACLALSGAIRGSSREKRYQELGLDDGTSMMVQETFILQDFA